MSSTPTLRRRLRAFFMFSRRGSLIPISPAISSSFETNTTFSPFAKSADACSRMECVWIPLSLRNFLLPTRIVEPPTVVYTPRPTIVLTSPCCGMRTPSRVAASRIADAIGCFEVSSAAAA